MACQPLRESHFTTDRVSAVQGSPEVKMADVARRAGVSVSTVSRALRGVPGVTDETRERIRSIADQLAYVVSPEASGLARGTTGRVGVVVPRTDVWFYGEMLGNIEAALSEADLDVLIYQVRDQAQRTRFFRELPSRRKVDAVVLIALSMPRTEIDRLDLLGVEVVVAGSRVRDFPSVAVDDRAIARVAVDHLIELGHRRIAIIRALGEGDIHWEPDVHRAEGYRAALEAAGLPVRDEYSVAAPFSIAGGVRAAEQLLGLAEPPTAIFAFSDELALGALEAARRAGIAVPDDLSIMGVDDHPMAEAFGLSTVRQDVARQGRTAAEMVVRRLRGEAPEPEVLIPHELVIRQTTASPAARSS
jgi:LacI family repressor for deo operon, udp, cdd, tsx, nupC, and nupG